MKELQETLAQTVNSEHGQKRTMSFTPQGYMFWALAAA